MRVKIDLYGFGHHTPWVTTDWYCPNCGERGQVVRQDDGGDYYAGEEHVCLNCSVSFHDAGFSLDHKDEKRAEMLREAFKTDPSSAS